MLYNILMENLGDCLKEFLALFIPIHIHTELNASVSL